MTTYANPLAGSDYESLMRQVRSLSDRLDRLEDQGDGNPYEVALMRSLSDRLDRLEGAPAWGAGEAADLGEGISCGWAPPAGKSPSDQAPDDWEDVIECGTGLEQPRPEPDPLLSSLHDRFQEREATGAGPYIPPTPGLAAHAIQTIKCGEIVHGAARLRSSYETIIVSSGSMSEEQARVLEFYIETMLADKPVGFRAFGPGRYAFLRVGRELYSSRDRLFFGGQTSRSVICSGHEFTDAQLRKFEELLDAVLGRQICTAYQMDP